MNQNLTYTYAAPQDHRSNGQQNTNQQQGQSFNSYSSFHPTATYTSSSTLPFHSSGNSTFIPNNISAPGQNQGQTEIRLVSAQTEPAEQRYVQLNTQGQDDKIAALLDSYFIEQGTPQNSTWAPAPSQAQPGTSQVQYGAQSLMSMKSVQKMTPEKADKEKVKRAKQAEAARLRYHRLTAEEKRELNLKRTLAQKRKRQREKEMEQLEEILRQSNDIQEDPDITEQLREKRMRAKWAEAARARYQRMTPEERRAHNNRRRMRQMQNALAATKAAGELTGDPNKDEEAIKRHIKLMNAKKAEAARARYHRMSDEEKRAYNQRRTEAFRRRRMEEEMLLAMPIGRINGEALDRAQQIVVRNAKRAEAARLRYQRMTPEQRKAYNQKRYTPKRTTKRDGIMETSGMSLPKKGEDFDVLSTIERDVMKRTQQAQQALLRQQRAQQPDLGTMSQSGQPGQQSQQGQSYLLPGTSQPTSAAQQISHQTLQQVVQVSGGQVIHQVQVPSNAQSGSHQIAQITAAHQGQQQQGNQQQTQQILQQHQQQQQQQQQQQLNYSANGNMMISGSGQPIHQQIINNPYGQPNRA